jgi:hypothetical protein
VPVIETLTTTDVSETMFVAGVWVLASPFGFPSGIGELGEKL